MLGAGIADGTGLGLPVALGPAVALGPGAADGEGAGDGFGIIRVSLAISLMVCFVRSSALVTTHRYCEPSSAAEKFNTSSLLVADPA